MEPPVEPEELAEFVSARWAHLREEAAKPYPHIVELVDVISFFPKLHSLFPFTSVGRLCLSRCTHFPYYVDYLVSYRAPHYVAEVTLEGGGWVYTKEVGAGSARDALRLLDELVPADYGPARHGDAELLFPAAH